MKYEVSISEEGLDWELITQKNQKKIKIIFIKHIYIPGSIIWWSRCFINDPEIDTTTIPARNMRQVQQTSNFAEIWRESNQKFIEEMKENNREVDSDLGEHS